MSQVPSALHQALLECARLLLRSSPPGVSAQITLNAGTRFESLSGAVSWGQAEIDVAISIEMPIDAQLLCEHTAVGRLAMTPAGKTDLLWMSVQENTTRR